MSTLENTPSTQTRREFCALACQAASVLAAGIATACGGGQTGPSSGSAPAAPVLNGTVAGRTISVSVDGTVLATTGNGALVQTSLGSFLLARTGQDTFNAMTAICTHENNLVTGFSGGRFVCNVHGSEFSTSGNAVAGPARGTLRQYAAAFANGVVTFTV